MKRCSWFLLLGFAVSLHAAPGYRVPDVEKRTASGTVILFQAGNWKLTEEYDYLRTLDRELTRLFLPPPGGCRIYVSGDLASGEIRRRIRSGKHEIVLGKDFIACSSDPVFYLRLAARILSARFGFPAGTRPLPYWMQPGLTTLLRQQEFDIGARNRQNYYPVLRMLLAAGIMPDFRALMQMKEADFTGSGEAMAEEFSRFLLLTFSRRSTRQRNALGDYTAGMLKGDHPEPALYRTFLQPVMRNQQTVLSEADFFRTEAERAAFNHQFPRSVQALLKQLSETLRYSVPAAGKKFPASTGSAEDLPQLFADKHPHAFAAQQQLRTALRHYSATFSPAMLGAANELQEAVANISGEDPEEEAAAVQKARKLLEQRLLTWRKVEQYLENCEEQLIPACLRLQNQLRQASAPEELLTAPEKTFLERTEKSYLEE